MRCSQLLQGDGMNVPSCSHTSLQLGAVEGGADGVHYARSHGAGRHSGAMGTLIYQ